MNRDRDLPLDRDSFARSLFAGLGLGLSLIIAIGAQNVFVLRQGIRRKHVLAVVILCAVSDAVLIAVGISGIGAVLEQLPWLLPVARWAGAVFLVGYGLLAARRALRPGATGLLAETAGGRDESELEAVAVSTSTVRRARLRRAPAVPTPRVPRHPLPDLAGPSGAREHSPPRLPRPSH